MWRLPEGRGSFARRLARPIQRFDALDRALAAAVVLFVIASLGAIWPTGLRLGMESPGIDLVVDTLATAVTAAVVTLLWVRYRERGDPTGLLQAAAFLATTVGNAYATVLALGTFDEVPGLAFHDLGQSPLYVTTFARALLGLFIVAAGVSAIRRVGAGIPRAVVAIPACSVALVAAVGALVASSLPALAEPYAGLVGFAPGAVLPEPPYATPLGAALQLVVATVFLAGALVTRRLFRRDRAVGDAYLAVGLVIMAAAQVQFALRPGTFPGVVTSGDALRVAFDVVLLLGVQAEARSTLADLRRANRELHELRRLESERAILDERTRLSRELHDGLAQHLWLAKLKASQLASLPGLEPAEAHELAEQLGAVVDAGLSDARQAVNALRAARADGMPLGELLRQYAEDFGDRFGLPVRIELAGDPWPVDPRAEAEILRVAQEALTNARRHADATLVEVALRATSGQIVLSVSDNGKGFLLADVPRGRFGLASMRERAAIVGGRVAIESGPGDGTRVTLTVPAETRLTGSPAAVRAPIS